MGNNSSGTTSIKYGVTRDKIQSVECVLYDGSVVLFEAKELEECFKKGSKSDLEHQIYQFFTEILSNPDYQKEYSNRVSQFYCSSEEYRLCSRCTIKSFYGP